MTATACHACFGPYIQSKERQGFWRSTNFSRSIRSPSTGQEGQERFQEIGDVELVLVDWNMPVMNGLEFVQSVRADRSRDHTKLVMVTTETEPSRMARALMAGVDEFVMKPFTPEILLDKLRLLGVRMPLGTLN